MGIDIIGAMVILFKKDLELLDKPQWNGKEKTDVIRTGTKL
jgi:hypothetical protein